MVLCYNKLLKEQIMKLICDGLDLADAVNTVARAANARAVNPILEGIKLVAKGGKLTLSATDLEIYTNRTIRADIKIEGTVVVPGKLFSEYVRKISGSQISITVAGDTVVINHGDSVCSFQTMLLAEYPEIVKLSSKPHFSIKSEDFRDFISKSVISASADDSRPVLKGVLCEIKGETLTGVALDGFRLSKVQKKIANLAGDLKIIVPARALDETRKLLDGDSGEVSVTVENKFFQVSLDGTTFASRLIDGEFINYKQIIPASFDNSVVVERTVFEQSVERAGLLVRNDKINLVSLKIADKKIGIVSSNEIGKVDEVIAASLSGKDIKISFNAKYLHDALRASASDFVKLQYTAETSPCVITAAKDSDCMFLILPVRTN
jgi:DNA polymerase-3 subunit beta